MHMKTYEKNSISKAMSSITIVQYYMVTSTWEPCTWSNKCWRLNIYLVTSSLLRVIRATRYLGLTKLSLYNNISLPCHTKGFHFPAHFSLGKDLSVWGSCSYSEFHQYLSSLTAFLCSKWCFLSIDFSASWLPHLTPWLLFWLVLVTSSSSDC